MAQLKYHEIWDAFEARLRSLFLHCNGKQVVIWGYGHSGRFLEHVFRRHGKQIELRMDADGKVRGVERPVILGQLDPETHVVLLTFPPTEDVIERLERHGFRRGTSYLPVVEFFMEGKKFAVSITTIGSSIWLRQRISGKRRWM